MSNIRTSKKYAKYHYVCNLSCAHANCMRTYHHICMHIIRNLQINMQKVLCTGTIDLNICRNLWSLVNVNMQAFIQYSTHKRYLHVQISETLNNIDPVCRICTDPAETPYLQTTQIWLTLWDYYNFDLHNSLRYLARPVKVWWLTGAGWLCLWLCHIVIMHITGAWWSGLSGGPVAAMKP